jgi:hypothetical protein
MPSHTPDHEHRTPFLSISEIKEEKTKQLLIRQGHYIRIAQIVNRKRQRDITSSIEESPTGVSYLGMEDSEVLSLQDLSEIDADYLDFVDDVQFPNPFEFEVFSTDFGTSTKGKTVFPEFTVGDSQRLVNQIVKEAGLDPNNPETHMRIAEKLFKNLKIDKYTGKVDVIVSPDVVLNEPDTYIKSREDKAINFYNVQVQHDATILLDGNLLAVALNSASPRGLLGATAEEAAAIKRKILTGDNILDPEDPLIGDNNEKTLNWLLAWKENTPKMKTYLATGHITDDNGMNITTDPVSGWNRNDVTGSMNALVDWETDNPNRIIQGESLIPQWGNTFEEIRQGKINDKIRDWGWNQDESILNNIDYILSKNKRGVTDQLVYETSEERYSARHTRDKIVSYVTDSMDRSVFEEGTKEYADEAVERLFEIIGSSFGKYDAIQKRTFSELKAIDWRIDTADGKDAAAKEILNQFGYRKNQLTDEDFRTLADLLSNENASSIGAALENDQIRDFAERAVENKIEQEISKADKDAKDDLNKPSNITYLVKSALRKQGILGATTSSEFEARLDSYTIPELVRRIINISGVDGLTNPNDIDAYVEQFTDQGILGSPGQLSALDVNESDFTRQYMTDSVIPPMAPGMSEFRQYRAQTLAPIEEAEFDIASLSPELQTLAFERPEFAKFLSIQMSDPEYMKEFKELGTDRLKTTEEGEPLYKETLAEFGKRSAEAIQEAKQAKESLESMKKIPTGDMDPEILEFSISQAKSFADAAQKRADEAVKYTGPEFAKTLYETQRVKGMTTEEFFESKLPGFEQQFKGSAFEKAAEERKRRENEIEESRRRRDIARTSARTIVRGRQ